MPQTPYSATPGHSYVNISTQTTTVVKANAGILRAISFNSATSGAVITIYDNASAASGTKIATMTLGAAITTPQQPVLRDVKFANGLTILTATQNADFTVIYD